MKLENSGYRLNQRLNKGTICGSFEWKIRLQLSQTYSYKPIALVTPKMSSILLVPFTFKSRVFRFMLPILGWVYLLLKPTYQAAEIRRYTEHTCDYLLIRDIWFSGKVSVQLTDQKRAEYVMVLCNPRGCK